MRAGAGSKMGAHLALCTLLRNKIIQAHVQGCLRHVAEEVLQRMGWRILMGSAVRRWAGKQWLKGARNESGEAFGKRWSRGALWRGVGSNSLERWWGPPGH